MITDWRKRLLLAIALFLAAGSTLADSEPLQVLPYPRGLASVFDLAVLTTDAGRLGAMALTALLLGVFVAGHRMQLVGWLLVLLAWVEHDVCWSLQALAADDPQGSQEPFTTLIAWLIGLALAPRLGRDRDELGGSLACGILGAGYTMGALSKLRHSGVGWVDGRAMALLVYERAEGAGFPLSALRELVASHVTLATAMMALSLVIELSGFLFLFRAARRPMAAIVVTMHVSIGVLLGYFHLDWAMTAVAWAVAAGGRRQQAEAVPLQATGTA